MEAWVPLIALVVGFAAGAVWMDHIWDGALSKFEHGPPLGSRGYRIAGIARDWSRQAADDDPRKWSA